MPDGSVAWLELADVAEGRRWRGDVAELEVHIERLPVECPTGEVGGMEGFQLRRERDAPRRDSDVQRLDPETVAGEDGESPGASAEPRQEGGGGRGVQVRVRRSRTCQASSARGRPRPRFGGEGERAPGSGLPLSVMWRADNIRGLGAPRRQPTRV